jgi:hypothetical protein
VAGHTFLFREGDWRAAGEYRDGGGAATPVDGATRIRHEAGRWISEGLMTVRRNPPQEHRNRYDITPFSPGAQSTHWTAENASVGTLNGRFVLAGDTILSFYASATGRYRGYESMRQTNERRYAVRGAMLDQDKLISTWVLELELAP